MMKLLMKIVKMIVIVIIILKIKSKEEIKNIELFR